MRNEMRLLAILDLLITAASAVGLVLLSVFFIVGFLLLVGLL